MAIKASDRTVLQHNKTGLAKQTGSKKQNTREMFLTIQFNIAHILSLNFNMKIGFIDRLKVIKIIYKLSFLCFFM